jgi:penicillin-binding protein 1A
MKNYLSYSLGAGETTLLRLTSAYGMLVNGGKKIQPTLIDRIQDRHGKTIFAHDQRPCPNCGDLIRWDGQTTPNIPDAREQIADEKTAYQITSILEGVIERGTGRRLKEIGRPLAGKTGTTNKSKDTWFIGFSPNLVAGVFVGFDDPKSLGKRETGSSAAAPIWGDFMKQALADTPPMPFRVPPGMKNVRVNAQTGRLAQAGDEDVIWEAFVSGTEPGTANFVRSMDVIDDGVVNPYGDDPYGYNSFISENEIIYSDENVEVYGLDNANEDNPFSYFSNRRGYQNPEQPNGQRNIQPNNPSQERVYPPIYGEERTAPVEPRPTQDPNFTGTGGLY